MIDMCDEIHAKSMFHVRVIFHYAINKPLAKLRAKRPESRSLPGSPGRTVFKHNHAARGNRSCQIETAVVRKTGLIDRCPTIASVIRHANTGFLSFLLLSSILPSLESSLSYSRSYFSCPSSHLRA